MNLIMLAPPEGTGNTEKDLEELREWCTILLAQLKKIFYTIDSLN